MRRRDDDLAPFRDDPVVRAITSSGTPEELAGEAEALAAFRANAEVLPKRRTAARVAASGTAAVVLVALSGGVAAAYTAHLPESAQQALHDALGPIGIPAPHHHHHKGSVAATPITSPAPAPVPAQSSTSAQPNTSPSAAVVDTASPSVTPTSTSTLPVLVPTPTVSPTVTSTPTPSPTPTSTHGGPLQGATLDIIVSEPKVAVGSSVTVTGHLDSAEAAPIAGRKVGLRYRAAGVPGWTRLVPQSTTSDGAVSFTVTNVQHNLRLVLHSGRHVHSAVSRVSVVPIITVRVSPVAAGASSTAVSVTVAGGQAGDVVTIRQAGVRGHGLRATLDGSLSATFSLPVSQSSKIHYRVFVSRSKAHAAHSLAFYVPASG